MTWIGPWIGWASNSEIKAECERRNLHQTVASIPPPKIYGTISATDLINLLPQSYTGIDGKVYYVRKDIGFNSQYNLTSIEEIKRFLAWNQIDKREYVLDKWDCNTFAIATWGAYLLWGDNTVFGAVICKDHMMNWALDYKRKFWNIEPQSDVVKSGLPDVSAHFMLSQKVGRKTP